MKLIRSCVDRSYKVREILTVRLARTGRDVLVARLGVLGNDVALTPVLLAQLDSASGRDGVLVLPLGGVAAVGALVVAGCDGSLSLLCGCALALASGGTIVPVVASEAVAAETAALRAKAGSRTNAGPVGRSMVTNTGLTGRVETNA